MSNNRKPIPRKKFMELIKKRGSVKCEMCENRKDGQVDDFDHISHKDGDRTNDSPSNLQLLCRKCHRYYDYYIKVEHAHLHDEIRYARSIQELQNQLKLPINKRDKTEITYRAPTDRELKANIKTKAEMLTHSYEEGKKVKPRFFGERFTQWRKGETVNVW